MWQDGYAVLLTGHSLGGGMAQLIGSVEGWLGVAGNVKDFRMELYFSLDYKVMLLTYFIASTTVVYM